MTDAVTRHAEADSGNDLAIAENTASNRRTLAAARSRKLRARRRWGSWRGTGAWLGEDRVHAGDLRRSPCTQSITRDVTAAKPARAVIPHDRKIYCANLCVEILARATLNVRVLPAVKSQQQANKASRAVRVSLMRARPAVPWTFAEKSCLSLLVGY